MNKKKPWEERTLVEDLKAYEFAQKKHKGQLDDSGRDYFKAHVVPVAKALELMGWDEDVLSAALLHDTLEDTDTTYEELLRVFGMVITNLVTEVTHEGKKDHHGYFFPHLKTKRGISIKVADRLSNLSRIEAWPEERQEQYLRKTKFWYKDKEEKKAVEKMRHELGKDKEKR